MKHTHRICQWCGGVKLGGFGLGFCGGRSQEGRKDTTEWASGRNPRAVMKSVVKRDVLSVN